MSCVYCGKDVVYRCCVCGKLVCAEHAKLRTVCPSCRKKSTLRYAINEVASHEERAKIREFVKQFWGEEEQLAFDRRFVVAGLPAYVAIVEEGIAAFVSFAELGNAIIIVALGVLPEYQSSGIGSGLVGKVESKAKKMSKRELLVSTSNDDLPALAFYQTLGFQLFEVKPDVIAEKHGKAVDGIGGLPVRDELRLRKIL